MVFTLALTAFINGVLVTPAREIADGVLIVNGDRIDSLGRAGEVMVPQGATVIDLKGAYLSPGFIDLHLHGAWGGDVMNAEAADLQKMARGLVRGGTTAFLPTTLSGPWSAITAAVETISQQMAAETGGARIIGAHLEGPFFNKAQCGAQNPEYIINPKLEELVTFLDQYSCVKRISAAPEIPGGLELGQELRKRKIVAAIAHSDATYQQVLQAVENGYSHVTHIFSGMSGLRRVEAYRVSGVIESTLLLDELTTEMIADGHHLPPSLMKLVLKTKGLDRVCLVTDSMAAAGLGPGGYRLGGLDVIIESDIPEVFEVATQQNNFVAKLTDRTAFASSVATMDQLVCNMVNLVGLNIREAVQLVTVNPARMQGLGSELGVLARGMKADLTAFNKDIQIKLTMVDGVIVHQA